MLIIVDMDMRLSVRRIKRKSREPFNQVKGILQRQGIYQGLGCLASLKYSMYLSINSFKMHEMEYTCISMRDKFIACFQALKEQLKSELESYFTVPLLNYNNIISVYNLGATTILGARRNNHDRKGASSSDKRTMVVIIFQRYSDRI